MINYLRPVPQDRRRSFSELANEAETEPLNGRDDD